ncbi:MAG: hypothetical protein ACOYEW_10085 [Anaerolineae bacterium]
MRQSSPKGNGSIAFERLVSACKRLSSLDERILVEQVLPDLERELRSAPSAPRYHRLHRPWRNISLSREEQESLTRRRQVIPEDEQEDDQPARPE